MGVGGGLVEMGPFGCSVDRVLLWLELLVLCQARNRPRIRLPWRKKSLR
jgi:hypothetical protein